tara:strand:- start:773 stop:1426 length:654 start_codon:yes stop_codon:yes gene_type:complete
MYQKKIEQILDNTLLTHPRLFSSLTDIKNTFDLLCNCYSKDNKLLICGNGGSASDSDHIVGELMKNFAFNRTLPSELKQKLVTTAPHFGQKLSDKLQPALPAISLTSHSALNTAFANDVDPELTFAQQVIGYGGEGDVLIGISTSGNSSNVVYALIAARALGMPTIGLTGKTGGIMKEYCDIVICVEGNDTAEIQELHLPVYHALCKMLEINFFDNQ